MKIFDGKKEAEEILDGLKKKIAKAKIHPVLAVISAGKNPASELFVRNKKIAAKSAGIGVVEFKFSENAKKKAIIERIRQLNEDSNIHGIIVQLPLPKHLNAANVVGEILLKKDVDGFGGATKFFPPLISAILFALKELPKDIGHKNVSALVNSDIFGNGLKRFLIQKGLTVNYFLGGEILGKKERIKNSDVVISALGKPQFVKGDMIRKGAALIDAGIAVLDSGKVVGDVDKKSVSIAASFLTPVPGGVGPLTVAYLLQNVYDAAEYSKNH